MSKKVSNNRVYKPQSPFERLRFSCECKYKSLYRAVILQAIIDASGINTKNSIKNSKVYTEANDWLFKNEESILKNQFEMICDRAGLDPEFIRKIASEIIGLQNKSYGK